MPWFPIIAEEIAAAEARLGIALPLGYRAIVGDPRMRTLRATIDVGSPLATLVVGDAALAQSFVAEMAMAATH